MSKPGKSLRKTCKKLGVSLTVKRGKKRVYKSVKLLKSHCRKKLKKHAENHLGKMKKEMPWWVQSRMVSQHDAYLSDMMKELNKNYDLNFGKKKKVKGRRRKRRFGKEHIKKPSVSIGISFQEWNKLGPLYQLKFLDNEDSPVFIDGEKASSKQRQGLIIEAIDPTLWKQVKYKESDGFGKEDIQQSYVPLVGINKLMDINPCLFCDTISRKYGKRIRKRKKKVSAALKRLCKKHKVRLTVKRGKKRVYKSEKVLKKQCKNKMKKKK